LVRPRGLLLEARAEGVSPAVAVVSLAREGRVKLDGPIGNLVHHLDPSVARLTPHQLLTHTAGLKDEVVWNGPHDDSALARGVRRWKEDRFFAEPGGAYRYSN